MLKAPENIPKRVASSLLVLSFAFGGTVFALIFWMTTEANKIARDASVDLVAASVQSQVDQIAALTQDYAYWEEAYFWVTDADEAKIKSNLGSTAQDGQLFQHLWITTADGAPLYDYAMGVDGPDAGRFDAAIVTPYLAALTARPLEPYETLSGLVTLKGRLAIVAAGRVQLYETEGYSASDFPVLFTVAYLSEHDSAGAISFENAPTVLQFTATDAALDNLGAALVLTDIGGNPLGQLSWVPPRPGDALFASALPVSIILVIIMIGISVMVGRAIAEQSRALVVEHINARTDELTGVLNLTALEELLASARIKAALKKGHLAVAYIDVNQFKTLNDTHGHAVGDSALCKIAARLKGAMGKAGYVVRKGGDEFLCIIEAPNPRPLAHQFGKQLAAPTMVRKGIEGSDLVLGLSIGVAVSDGKTSWDKLLRQADRAMYHAKKSQIYGAVFFDKLDKRGVQAA